MEILHDGKSNLEELFADLDHEFRLVNRKESKNSDRIIPGFRSVLKLQNLPERFIKLFEKKKTLTESN
ncbi:hypothetical protein AKJ60_00895 [candidate division MSBL1 archaeon SCGC-AAA385M11]|nr:hypothetical protein AKJ60_00895 [candidate division MSBL1 archaeon SCGC-AAA385M11]